jgi:hypothetical protein
MKHIYWVVLVMTLLPPVRLCAEEPGDYTDDLLHLAQWAEISGSIRAGYWSSSRTLDDREHFVTAALWLKAAPKLWSHTSILVEGWIRNQELFHTDATQTKLREAYLDASLGPVDVRVGKQLIVWGRADRINPTDNLTPKDFTLLVPEDDDQRFGTVAVKATYYLAGIALTGIWLPDFEPHTVPIRRPPPPLTLREQVPSGPSGQWAIRIEQTGKAVDWSLSYFDGFDLFPDLGIDQASASSVALLLRHHRIRVIGADAATTVGRYGLRGELAYTFTEDRQGNNPFVKNPFFFMVIGGDRTFFEYLNINVQYILRIVTGHQSPLEIPDPLQRVVATQQAVVTNQLDRWHHAVSLRMSHKWLNESLEGEVVGVLSFTRFGYVILPKVSYAFTDRWKGIIGVDFFGGGRHAFFGNLRDNSTVYAELRWSF